MVNRDPMLNESICSYAAMRRATRRMGQIFDDALTPCGLKTTQMGLLSQIQRLGSPTLKVLADAIVMDLSALGHTLKPLERDGFVEIRKDPQDGRAKRVGLTEAGQRKLQEAAKLWRTVHDRCEDVLEPDKARELRRTLDWIASIEFAQQFGSVLESSADKGPGRYPPRMSPSR